MVDTTTRDTSHVDELRQGSRYCLETKHPNICDLVGVAADPECFAWRPTIARAALVVAS
jgi:hypothetical protein